MVLWSLFQLTTPKGKIMHYLYINGSECSDAMRDRDFYEVQADNEVQADVFLQAHLIAIAQDDLTDNLASDHALFISSESPFIRGEGVYNTQTFENAKDNVSHDLLVTIHEVEQYASNDGLEVSLYQDGDGEHHYGVGDYSVKLGYTKELGLYGIICGG